MDATPLECRGRDGHRTQHSAPNYYDIPRGQPALRAARQRGLVRGRAASGRRGVAKLSLGQLGAPGVAITQCPWSLRRKLFERAGRPGRAARPGSFAEKWRRPGKKEKRKSSGRKRRPNTRSPSSLTPGRAAHPLTSDPELEALTRTLSELSLLSRCCHLARLPGGSAPTRVIPAAISSSTASLARHPRVAVATTADSDYVHSGRSAAATCG